MSSIVVESLVLITRTYLVLLFWQGLFWPITSRIFSFLPDKAWSITRMLGILTVSLTLWTTGNLGLRSNSNFGVLVVLAITIMVLFWLIKVDGWKKLYPQKVDLRTVVMAEYLFLSGYFLISFVRGYLPDLDSLEKFMDYGFVVTYLRSESLPAIDMWQAGSFINYYSFGHYWASVLVRTMMVDPAVGYNLVLGFIGGTVAAITMVLVTAISKLRERINIVGGLLAAIAMIFGGNGHTAWYFFSNWSFEKYWYADATRFIYNTIHEFPAYSLIVSDLHGHLLDLPIVLTYLLILTFIRKSSNAIYLVFLGGLLGVMMMTNTWDVLVYGLLTGIYYLILFARRKIDLTTVVKHAASVSLAMGITMSLWWLKFVPISSGIKLVAERSPIWQLAVLWTIAGLICSLGFVLKKQGKSSVILALCTSVFFLILIPELIYFKDIYPDHPRANTMFKLTYQAFVISVVVFGVVMSLAINKLKRGFAKTLLMFVLIAVFVAKMSFSALAYPSFYGNFKNYYGLDGEEWLKDDSEVKYKFLEYLKSEDDGQSSMVEAVGDSYTKMNVLSAYTGIPTVQGWRVHEWLWRGGYEPVAQRETEVREIYEGKDESLTKEIIKKYKVRWIVVGPDEDKQYLINHQKLSSLGKQVFISGDYYLILVDQL